MLHHKRIVRYDVQSRFEGEHCVQDIEKQGIIKYGSCIRPMLANLCDSADVAQLVEHVHGKDGVVGSSPTIGSS